MLRVTDYILPIADRILRTLQKEQQEVLKMNLFNLRKLINGLINIFFKKEREVMGNELHITYYILHITYYRPQGVMQHLRNGISSLISLDWLVDIVFQLIRITWFTKQRR